MTGIHGTLRVYLAAASLLEVLGEIEDDQEIERHVYQIQEREVECALCFGDRVILTKGDKGVTMQYMDSPPPRKWPNGVNPGRITAIVLSGIVLPPTIIPARYNPTKRGWLYAWPVRHITARDDTPDPPADVTFTWRFMSKRESIEEVFDLLEEVQTGLIQPAEIEGKDYASGAELQYITNDGEVMTHVLPEIYPLKSREEPM